MAMARARPLSFLTLGDISTDDWPRLFDRTATLKAERDRVRPTPLAGMTVALVFDKPSTRTRVSFQVAPDELGGQTVEMSLATSQLGRGEPISDTARVLSGYCHAIVVRTFGQDRIAEYAKGAAVPVITGASDEPRARGVAPRVLTVVRGHRRAAGLRTAGRCSRAVNSQVAP